MEGHPFRFISLCGRVFIELNPRCYEKLVPKGLVLGIKTRSIDVLLESSALHQKIVHHATQMLSSDWLFNSFHAAGSNRRPDFSLSWGFDLSSTNKSAIPQRRSSCPPNPPIGGGPRPTLGAQVSLKLLFGYVTIFSSADLFTTDLNCRKKLACDIISKCNVILSRRI